MHGNSQTEQRCAKEVVDFLNPAKSIGVSVPLNFFLWYELIRFRNLPVGVAMLDRQKLSPFEFEYWVVAT